MTFKLIVRPLAEEDLKEAMEWYNLQVDGLGEKFIHFIDRKIAEIIANPKQYQVRYKNVRAALVDKFPFCTHFMVVDNTVIVHSFYHTSRNPKRVIKRLK